MEKLESVLHAEEAARKTLEVARLHAHGLIEQARTQAEIVRAEAELEAAGKSGHLIERIVREAQAEAESIAAQAEIEIDSLVQQAEARFESAVQAVVKSLRSGL